MLPTTGIDPKIIAKIKKMGKRIYCYANKVPDYTKPLPPLSAYDKVIDLSSYRRKPLQVDNSQLRIFLNRYGTESLYTIVKHYPFIDDIITGCCRLNGSLKDNTKDLSQQIIYEFLFYLDTINHLNIEQMTEEQGKEYSDRWVRYLTSVTGTASQLLIRQVNKLSLEESEWDYTELPDRLWTID